MRYSIKVFAALAFVAVLASMPVAPVSADARADFKAAVAAKNAGNWGEAIRLFTRVIRSGELKGNNLAIAYYNRGNAFSTKRQNDPAIADFTKAIALKPQFADAYNSRGATHYNKRQYDRAIADYTKAIEIRPNYVISYYGRGTVHATKRQYDRSIADFTRAIELKPKFASAFNNRGFVYQLMGRKELAIKDFRTVLRLNPSHARARANLKALGATP